MSAAAPINGPLVRQAGHLLRSLGQGIARVGLAFQGGEGVRETSELRNLTERTGDWGSDAAGVQELNANRSAVEG